MARAKLGTDRLEVFDHFKGVEELGSSEGLRAGTDKIQNERDADAEGRREGGRAGGREGGKNRGREGGRKGGREGGREGQRQDQYFEAQITLSIVDQAEGGTYQVLDHVCKSLLVILLVD